MMRMTVEFEIVDDRSPKCIARLVAADVDEKESEPTSEDFEREGRGEDPMQALDDLLLGDLRASLRRAFTEEASP